MNRTLGAAFLSIGLVSGAHSQSLTNPTQGTGFAPMGIADPQMVIYRVIGVFDDGQAGHQGASTAFICTNIATTTEQVRIRVFRNDASLAQDGVYDIAAKVTFTMATHTSLSLNENASLNTGAITQGHAVIFATTTNIACTAMIVNAAGSYPYGIPLTMLRYNAHPGTSE